MADYWNAFSAMYAYDFSPINTVVFTSADLLFRWPEVVAALQRWLPPRGDADFTEEARLRDVASTQDHLSRTLEQARAFYAQPSSRLVGFREEELRHMAEGLDRAQMARWGFQWDAVGDGPARDMPRSSP